VVALDSLESVSVGVFTERIGTLTPHRMREVCAALAVAVDC
jgi:mRNA interferase MazF